MGKNYAERYAHRRSLGLKILQSLGEGPMADVSTIPAPLIEGYSREYYSQPRGLVDKTAMAHERKLAWFLSKLQRSFRD